MDSFEFPKSMRLLRPAEFQRVLKGEKSVRDRHVRVFAARNGGTCSRLGLAVSRRAGNAVRRGKWKRMCREAFRLSQHELSPGLDLVIIPAASEVPSLDALRASLLKLVARLDSLLAGASPP